MNISGDDKQPDEAAPQGAASPELEQDGHGGRSADERTRDGDMLADLLELDEAMLEAFRTEHMGAVSAASDEDLLRARHLLQAVVSAVREGSGERWRRVEAACDALEGTHRPGNTLRPPLGALGADDHELEDSEDEAGDRPTTPPALPEMLAPEAATAEVLPAPGVGADSGWGDPSQDALRAPPLPNLASTQAVQPPVPTQHGHPDPAAWTQAQGPGQAYADHPPQAVTTQLVQQAPAQEPSPAAAPHTAQPQAPVDPAAAPHGWGQAYAPGSLPAVTGQAPAAAPPIPQVTGPQVAGQPYAQPTVPLAPQAAAAPPVGAAPLSASYQPAARSTSDEVRDPTPPLFSPEPTRQLPPASARTPVAALPDDPDGVPSSARTPVAALPDDPDRLPSSARTPVHTPQPSPSPPPATATGPRTATAPFPTDSVAADSVASDRVPNDSGAPPRGRDASGGTAELTFSSQAHALALSLEEYATLCAERDLAAAGEQQEVERRYEIYDPRARAAVDRAFELRLTREPELRARFQQLYREVAARICDHTP